jgi:hypothetical protein
MKDFDNENVFLSKHLWNDVVSKQAAIVIFIDFGVLALSSGILKVIYGMD